MSWIVGNNRNLFREPKSILGLNFVVLKTPKTSGEFFTLTVVEMQQIQGNEKTDSKKEIVA